MLPWKLTIGLAAAALGLAGFAGPAALAAAGEDKPEIVVTRFLDPPADRPFAYVFYDDLNLTRMAGVEALGRRIEGTARQVCANHRTGAVHWANASYRRCVNFALAGAWPQAEQAVAYANRFRHPARWTLKTGR
ncbi:MAG: UrcA family protein [Sphingosinicella sp.]